MKWECIKKSGWFLFSDIKKCKKQYWFFKEIKKFQLLESGWFCFNVNKIVDLHIKEKDRIENEKWLKYIAFVKTMLFKNIEEVKKLELGKKGWKLKVDYTWILSPIIKKNDYELDFDKKNITLFERDGECDICDYNSYGILLWGKPIYRKGYKGKKLKEIIIWKDKNWNWYWGDELLGEGSYSFIRDILNKRNIIGVVYVCKHAFIDNHFSYFSLTSNPIYERQLEIDIEENIIVNIISIFLKKCVIIEV